MTRTHYQALADALGSSPTIDTAIDTIADLCAAENPRFNRAAFMTRIDIARDQAARDAHVAWHLRSRSAG